MAVGKDRSLETYSREEWLALRRRGVGGSDAPVIMGLSPYKGQLALYVEKLDLGLDPREPNEAAYWGQRLEEVVAREFEVRSGLRVVEPAHRLVTHPQHPWMLGTPDRYVHDPRTGAFLGVLEIKTTAARRDSEWEDGPAAYAFCQLQHYLAVTGALRGWVAVLIGGQRYQHYEVPRDDEYIVRLVEAEAEFWQRVESHDPPPPDGLPATSSILNAQLAEAEVHGSVELDGEALDAYHQLLASIAASPAQELDRLKNVIKVALGENSVGLVDGVPVVSWRTQSRATIDLAALRREHPDLVRRYERRAENRVFRTHTRRVGGDTDFYEIDT